MPKKPKRRVSSKKYKHQHDEKDSFGGANRTEIIDWKKITKEKIKRFKKRKGKIQFNVIPYVVSSKLNPLVKNKKLAIGDIEYSLDVWVHRRMGPDNNVEILCPKKNYGKACPACDLASQYYDKGGSEDKQYQATKAKQRSFFNVQPIVDGEQQALEVLEESHYQFTKELIEEANECSNGTDILPFADVGTLGSVVQFRSSPGTFKGSFDYKSFKFIDREEEVDEDLIDEALSFDKGLILLTADQIEEVMHGGDIDDDDDDEPEDDDIKEEEDDEPEEKPKKKKKKKPESEDDDDDDDDEPETPPKKSDKKNNKKKSDKSKCPHGHTFGEVDDHDECTDCESWDACDDAS